MTGICDGCGQRFDIARFCPNCGAAVKAEPRREPLSSSASSAPLAGATIPVPGGATAKEPAAVVRGEPLGGPSSSNGIPLG